MSNETQYVRTTNPPRRANGKHSPFRFALVFGLLVVSLPFLMMSFVMMGMGLMNPPMQGGMVGPATGFFPLVGFLAFVIVVGVLSGVYRLMVIDEAHN